MSAARDPRESDRHGAPWSLLTLCAQPRAAPGIAAAIAQRAGRLGDWTQLSDLAEHHGLAPLLHAHLTAAGVEPPRPARRCLHALVARHRHANLVRLGVLRDVLDAFELAGIAALVLKGAALAHLIYPDVGLRPMCDVDLLVPEGRTASAQRVLTELGFDTGGPGSHGDEGHHHLPAAVRWVDGVAVQVEIHRDAFAPDRKISLTLERPPPNGLVFTVAGRTAQTLGAAETLWHLCHHVLTPTHELRLISVADVVGIVDRFSAEIDWARVARVYPIVPRTLALLDCLVPLPDDGSAPPRPKPHRPPRGVGLRYTGWPLFPARSWDGVAGRLRMLRDTLAPPEWWLRPTYGTGVGRAGGLLARLRHAEFLLTSALARGRELAGSQPSRLRLRPDQNAGARAIAPASPSPAARPVAAGPPSPSRTVSRPLVYAVEINNPSLGFFAHLEWCLEILCHCARTGLVPFLKLTSDQYRSAGWGDNWLEYYFVQRKISRSIKDRLVAGEIETRRVGTIGHLGLPENYDRLLTFEVAPSLFREHLQIRPHVLETTSEFSERHFRHKPVMGLHFRGTDKVEAQRLSYEEIATKVRGYLDEAPEIRSIFVSSDEDAFLEFFRDRFEAYEILVRDDHRRSPEPQASPHARTSPTGRPVFLRGAAETDGYALGEDALVNSLLLSQCDVLLKTASIMSGWSKIFNPQLPVVMLTEPFPQFRWFPERDLCGREAGHRPG